MFSTVKAPSLNKPRAVRVSSEAGTLGYDFALLGLTAKEARVGVIRKAATDAARRVTSQASNKDEHHEMLSQVATSAYRLLDPRKRPKAFERVQLCLFSEEELELHKLARRPLLRRSNARLIAELAQSRH